MNGFHKAGTLGVLVAILFASLPPFARAADPSTPVSEEAGPVDSTWLGGGDHHFIRFGSDAAFGVLWGTNATPNNIYLVAIKARYLGVADVENAAGDTIVRDRAVRIYTMYAMKLGAILEFNDTNGDGVPTYSRAHTDLNYTGYNGVEPLYKYASLRTGWTDSPVTRVNTSTSRTWTFSLTAWNLPYVSINGSSAAGALDLLRFTFHLTTTVVRVDNATVPKYTITVEREPRARHRGRRDRREPVPEGPRRLVRRRRRVPVARGRPPELAERDRVGHRERHHGLSARAAPPGQLRDRGGRRLDLHRPPHVGVRVHGRQRDRHDVRAGPGRDRRRDCPPERDVRRVRPAHRVQLPRRQRHRARPDRQLGRLRDRERGPRQRWALARGADPRGGLPSKASHAAANVAAA